jgi:hypothetical protein
MLTGRSSPPRPQGTQETIEEGEAYYARPGRLPFLHAGTEVVEFSPTDDLQKTMEVVSKNMQATS